MKKISLLLLFVAAFALSANAQSQQELIEAYKNGTLTQSQIDNLQKKNEASNKNVRRTRSVETNLGSSNPKVTVAQEVTNMPDDPQMGLVENNLEGDRTVADEVGRAGVATGAAARLSRRIFGHDIFTNSQLTFEPNLNIATPDNYVLGSGDEVILDLWGIVGQQASNYKVSPDGKIVVDNVGPVAVAGLTIEEANKRLRSALAPYYEGIYDGSVKVKLSLGSIRSIQINIAGEVGVSGTYTLPSLATLFHALHSAGGVNTLGTMREIKLFRAGKLFSTVDVYEYIFNGKTDKDIALRDGDLISVGAYGKLVEISGEVKRPMFYEMAQSETVADLVRFAGDFSNTANRNMVSVTRRQGGQFRSFTVDAADFDKFVLEDGDAVSVAGSIDRYENRVEIKGAVYREGYYAISEEVSTLKQLIERADGLRDDAFTARALLYREKPDWTMEVKAVDLAGLMSGKVADIPLRANDMFVVSAVSEMQETFNVTIYGAVGKPDTYPYAEGMSVEDLLVTAGGLLESASTANITITRRIKDTKSTEVQNELFETFTVNINDDLQVEGGNDSFILQPFDQVFVRHSPVYITQSSVAVRGEVAFEGNYPLSHRNMRLSEVVAAAGNPTPGAFVEGAYLLRRMTAEERAQQVSLRNMIDAQAGNESDSLAMVTRQIQDIYVVGINLEEAMANPGSYADVVMRDGDVLVIPEYNATVRVMGAVMYPNSVTYLPKKSLKYYVKSAGGYGNRARKNRAFVIHMNGMVESGKHAKIRPGSIVIIPSKMRTEPVNISDIIGILSSTASTTAMVISAISLTK